MIRIESIRRELAALLAGRSRRERIALKTGAWILVLLVWGQMLWTAHREIDRLSVLVAIQHQENDAMRAVRQVLARLTGQRAVVRAIGGDQAIRLLADSLRAAGLAGLSAIPEGAGQARVTGTVGFDAWLEWVGRLHADAGIQVQRATVEPAGTVGMAKIDAILAWTEPK